MAAMEVPPSSFQQAIAEFNARQFFECHETLENLWKAEQSELRRFYQAILQIGVGYYKIITRPNYQGALALLQSGADYLRPFAPQHFGIDVTALIAAAEQAHQELLRLGPDHLTDFDPSLIPTIERMK
jgi:uncharacterized protein